MKGYRTGFFVALAVNVVLLGLAAGLWRNFRPMTSSRRSSASAPAAQALRPPPSPSASSSPPVTQQAPLAPLQLSPQRLQSIGVKTGAVARKAVIDHLLTTGNVAVDETRLAYVQVRVAGFIQKVFADATYQYVRRGQPLFTIYSPQLLATEREYLVARQTQRRLAHSPDADVRADADALVNAAAQRLQQWAIPQREIARLASSGQAQQDLTIDSPVTGFITERSVLPNAYVQPDTRLYTVADLSTIWVFAQVFQSDLGRLKAGDPVSLTVDTYPGRTFSGRVDFIYPDIDLATRTARVRLVFANPHLALIPGMFVNVSVGIPLGEQDVIPASGVLQTGTQQIAFVDHGGGHLEPRTVVLGARVGDDYIVLKGLQAGERIVTSANFLIDSESQLQAALGAFAPASPGAGAAGAAAIAAATRAPQASVQLTSDPTPPRKGNNVFRVTIKAANGAPIAGAVVTATFFMAAMPAMGMAATRLTIALSDQGRGRYQGHGRLASGGTWQVTILARKAGAVVASTQRSISASGGM